ncbi:MAG: substrate-binding domain-containing protein [Maritimibacter sp.]
MKILRAAFCAALSLATWLTPACADDVTLMSRDGAVEISGTLLGFDGEFYRVDTPYGILTVDGSAVRCDGPGCPNLGQYVAEFTLSGAREMGAVLMPALVEGFALSNGYAVARQDLPEAEMLYTLLENDGETVAARITIRLSTSSEGFADLVAEQTDMVMSLREVSQSERAMTRDAGLGDFSRLRQTRVVALDALVPIVAPVNPVSRISVEQLAAIYAGRISTWDGMGGEAAPVTLHLRDSDAGFGHIFVRSVMNAMGEKLSENTLHHSTNGGVTAAVAEDPFGIGIASFARHGFGEVLRLSGQCGFEIAATQETIKAGDYPLTAPMYLYLPERRLPVLARDLIRFLQTEQAQRIISRIGLVNQSLATIPLDHQGARITNAIRAAGPEIDLAELQRMMALFGEKERLSLTFRFQGGSTQLDGPSKSNIVLLAEALEAGRFDGKTITFVGFSDGQGQASLNRALSKRRADTVRREVVKAALAFDADRVAIATDGFGEALPMACDDSAWGRRINRRVEVWID